MPNIENNGKNFRKIGSNHHKIEELNEKIKLTRPRVPPKKFIQSESELDIEKSKAEVKENTQEEIKELDKLLEEKMTDIVHRQEVMYAYVRKLDGKSLIVPVKEIKNYKEPIISSNKYKLSIKGKLDPEFVFIDYVAESEEKLKEKINSKLPRVIKTPLKFAGTASDLSDMDKPIEPKKVEDPNLDKNLKDQLQQLKKNIMEAIVGTVRDGQIYCGHNVWISIREYEESKSTAARGKLASKYSRFVKEISCNIFGTEALRTCTLIKRCSSIRLNSNPKPLLDQNKLYAVQELFSYYLETEEGKSPDEIRYELVHVGVYIANAKNETATDHSAGLFEINCQPRHNQNDATCDFVAQESISNVESWDHHGEVDEADTVDMVDMVDVVDKMDIENEINEDPEEKEKDGDFVGNDINLDDFSNTIELDSDEDIEDSIDYNVEFDEYLIIDDDLKNVTVTNDTASFTGDDRIMFSESGLTVSDVMLMLQGLNVRFGTTRSMQNALLDFIKCLAGPSFKSWNYSSYKMSKTVAPPKTSMKKVFYCSECNIVLGDMLLSEEKKVPMTCVNCEKKYEISKKFEDYFISLDLKYQLQKLLDRKDIQESMLKNNSRVAHEDEDVIKDITDGELFQQNVTDPYALSLNFSLDGAQLFKSAKKAFWPLQAHLNCLFGKTRFRHPLIVVLWQTEKEPSPNMLNLIMNELIVQCNYINKEGGLEVTDILTGSVITKPIILYCACVDSVARPIMQNRLQFNGYYGCSYCYLIGLHKEGCVRYPMGKQIPEIRDHETHLEDLKLVNEMGIKSVHGVKGESVLLTIDNFDIIWNLPPDYMHNSLMGVTKQLTMFWKSALKKAEYEKLKKRMSHVKLSRDLRRSLRSLDHIAKYKALEWKMWLLFVSVPCLFDIIDEDMHKSYQLFVNSIFILLKKDITLDEIDNCECDLFQFVGNCQSQYGIKFMTYNIHTLMHYCESVRRCGPLWSLSAFPFESAIGRFIKEINAPNGCLKQISEKWLRRCTFESYIENNTSNSSCSVEYCKLLLQNKNYVHDATRLENVTLLGIGSENEEVENLMRKSIKNRNLRVDIFQRCIYKDFYLHTSNYSRVMKTCDSVVQLSDNRVMDIQYIVKTDNKCYICCHEWIIVPNEFNGPTLQSTVSHILKVKEKLKVMNVLNIDAQNQRKKKSQTPANKSAKSIEVVGNKKPNAINKRRSMDSADKKGPPPKKSKIDSNKENKIIEKNVQNLSTITELKKNEELSESSPETMPNDFNGALDNACAMSTLPSCISNETESTTDCSKKKLPDSVSKTAVNAVPNDTNNKSKLSSNSSAEVAKVTGKPTFTSSNPNVVKGNTSDKDKAIKSKVLNCSDKTTAALEAKEKEIKQLKKKLNDAKDSIERYKILLMDKHKEVQKYQQVNLDLQIKILDRVDENDSKAIDVVTGKPASEAAVGYVRKHDNQIHCGNNIYICKNSYDNARNKAASSKGGTENGLSKFVKDISTVIFGSETLKMSSVTGKPCNRYKSAAKPALDSMKLNSVYAIFKFYMSDTLQYDPVRIAQETTHVGTYIAQKIQDLNKKKRIPKKKNVEQNFYEEVIEKVQKVDEDDTDKDNYSDSGDISEKEEEEEERGEEEEEEEEEEENDDDEVRTIGSDEKND
ncbi:hypothetical protein TKK_0015337 [Trichogramma kaykai]